jgi:hypothetical protein
VLSKLLDKTSFLANILAILHFNPSEVKVKEKYVGPFCKDQLRRKMLRIKELMAELIRITK